MNASEKLPRNGHIQTIYEYLLGLIKKLDASIGSVRSRMNALTTLANSGGVPAGTIEAEVVDARVDSSGQVYANLGEAVRGQIEDVYDFFITSSEISEDDIVSKIIYQETSLNLANPDEFVEGKELAYSNGDAVLADSANKSTTGYIPIENGESYIGAVFYNGAWVNNQDGRVFYFNSEKQYVGWSPGKASAGFTINNENVKYVRFSFTSAYTHDVGLFKGSTLPETWIPYYDITEIKEEYIHFTSDDCFDDNTISSEKLQNIKTEKLPQYVNADNLYDYTARTDGYRYVNGNLMEAANSTISDYIEALPSTKYSVGVFWRDNWYYGATTYAYLFDENKNWIQQVAVNNGVMETTQNTAYFMIVINTAAVADFNRMACVCAGETLPRNYVPYSGKTRKLNPDYISFINRYVSSWSGKKFVSYGDSITQQNLWQPYVHTYFDMQSVVRGVGGSGFSFGVGYFWANADGSYNSVYHTGDTAPEGCYLCEASLPSDQRIETIPTDSDLIIIAGGTNDQNGSGTGAEIGTIAYTMVDGEPVFDTSTFKNAVCATVYKIMKRCPNAIVMLQTPVNTRAVDQVQTVNSFGYTLLDYVHAIKECAEYMSVPCIDVYGESGLNAFNMYLNGNNLHPDDAGARKMARATIAKLKCYEPRTSIFGW